MTADVPLEDWRQVQNAGAQVAVMTSESGDEPTGVCVDGGAVFAEIGLPAPHERTSAVNRQQAASNCQNSATLYFARLVSRLAEPLLPACAAIPADAVPGGIYRIHYCFRLSGDQMAAAEVMERAKRSMFIMDDDSVARKRLEWRRATGVDPWTRLRWAGLEVPTNPGGREAGGATDFLIARSADTPGLRFHPFRFHGVSATVVEVTGDASSQPAGPNGAYHYARYRQVWIRSQGSDWRVSEWSVETFAALP